MPGNTEEIYQIVLHVLCNGYNQFNTATLTRGSGEGVLYSAYSIVMVDLKYCWKVKEAEPPGKHRLSNKIEQSIFPPRPLDNKTTPEKSVNERRKAAPFRFKFEMF